MTVTLRQLSGTTLIALADKVTSGSLSPPYEALALGSAVDATLRAAVATELEALRSLNVEPAALAVVLRTLGEERLRAQKERDAIELVWTGPDVGQTTGRDARIVAAELFARATKSILVATYALHNGHQVLQPLAKRMEELPTLDVTLIVNIERLKGDDRSDQTIIDQFCHRFVHKEWPGPRRPSLFFDPRALRPVGDPQRAMMHAKCVVIDEELVLVTSANLTEAAQERNVEAGLVLADRLQAEHLTMQFKRLIKSHLQQVQL